MIIITAILPMLGVIIIGVLLQRSQLLGNDGVKVVSTLLTKLFFPVFLFAGIAKEKISTILNWPFISGFVATIAVTFILTLIFYTIFTRDKVDTNIFRGFSAACPNSGYIGIPLLWAVFGHQGFILAVITAIVSTLMMPLVLIFLQRSVVQKDSLLRTIFQLCKHIMQTPINIGIILGFLYLFAKLPYPKMLDNFTTIMGEATIPCALLSVGMVLAEQRITHLKEISFVSSIKLVVMPLIAILFAKLFDLPTIPAIALVISCALPTAIIDYMIAEEMHIFVRRASSIILLTTAISVISVPLLHRLALIVF